MSLLPSTPDVSRDDSGDPRVVDVDSEDAEEVLSALSSETARDLLSALYDDPAPPSTLADRVDTTLQNAQYHLENLEDAGAVEVVDTAYSAKGREMDVYAPADRPLVIFAGDEEKESTLRTALSRLLGAVGLLAVASFAVQRLLGPGGPLGTATDTAPEGASSAPAAGTESTPTPTPEEPAPTETAEAAGDQLVVQSTDEAANETQQYLTEAERTTTGANETTPTEVSPTETLDPETTTAAADATREVTAGLPPGLVFFVGGLFAIAVVAVLLSLRSR